MEIITFLIAVAGFLMSLASWMKELFSHRNQIELEIIDYKQYNHVVQFFLRLQNKSDIPASVSTILFSLDKKRWYSCELEPKKIKRTPSGYEASTPRFPVNLSPVSFSAEYFEFLGYEHTALVPGTEVSFQICTSRGTLDKSLTLGAPEHYLHIK